MGQGTLSQLDVRESYGYKVGHESYRLYIRTS